MKKLNNIGFTLIELLAVITIMGILMMVAIPSVSRTIENSRRDTFADNVKTYINTVRNAVLADELTCNGTTVSGTSNGTYYFVINTGDQGTKDLMEKVAKSSWGNVDLKGYIKWEKQTSTGTGEGERTRTKYYAFIGDNTNHGMKEEVAEEDITRSKIVTTGALQPGTSSGTSYPTGTECKLK